MSDGKHILFDIVDGVATITINRPEVKNSLNVDALSALFTALGTCEDRDDVGAVVLTGKGDAFCAGVNLKGYRLDNREELRAGFREVAMWWHQMLHRIVRLPKPVLAAVNGIAVGGGLGIVLASDLAVCNENASFFASWMANGVANDGGSSYSLAKIVGFRRAMELMLTNRTLTAREAVEW
jgi:2-(1,2-epoxy-1,2-dihydrophenyl)acetyl-CoA isomerase